MIERDGTDLELMCDQCLTPFDGVYDAADFNVMITDAKEAGWRVVIGTRGFEHICPDCDASANKRRRHG